MYIVAEMSANHNQDFSRARQIVEAAAEAGADAIKLQTYKPETITMDSQKDPFRIEGGTSWDDRYLFDLYEEARTPWPWHEDLQELARELGLDFFSTAFDESAVNFLEELDVPFHKTASFELTHLPLIKKMAKTGKPLIMSTGMATLGEIEEAVSTARNNGANELMLLRCVSSYPAPPEEMNLRSIQNLRETFQCPVGLSDHTLGTEVATAAVSLGARMVEKHVTLSRDESGPDSHFSLEPDEFQSMVESLRLVTKALGSPSYGPSDAESKNVQFRRSVFAVEDIQKGEAFTKENTRIIRPGHGLAPKHRSNLLGMKATQMIEAGTPIRWGLAER